MRGIAAISVIGWHEAALPWPAARPGSGYLAVDVFFVLSGLVLSHAYDARLATGLSPMQFLVSRLIRIYPLYLAGFLLASLGIAAAFTFHTRTNWGMGEFAVAFSFALLLIPAPSLHTNAIFPLNAPAWSLFFELVVNAAFGWLWRWLTTRFLVITVGFSAALLIAAGKGYSNLDLGSAWPTVWVGFPRVVYGFCLGILLSRRLQTRTSKLRVHPWLVLLALILVLWIDPRAWRIPYDLACVLVILPLLVWTGALVEPLGASRAIFSRLGAASYPMYAIHIPLLTIAARLEQGESGLGPAVGGLFIVMMIGVGLLLDRVDRFVRARLASLSIKMFHRLEPPAKRRSIAHP